MPLATFDLIFNFALGITVFICTALFVDIVWRRVARPGAKTRFERFLSRLTVSLFFIGTVLILLLVLSVIVPTQA